MQCNDWTGQYRAWIIKTTVTTMTHKGGQGETTIITFFFCSGVAERSVSSVMSSRSFNNVTICVQTLDEYFGVGVICVCLTFKCAFGGPSHNPRMALKHKKRQQQKSEWKFLHFYSKPFRYSHHTRNIAKPLCSMSMCVVCSGVCVSDENRIEKKYIKQINSQSRRNPIASTIFQCVWDFCVAGRTFGVTLCFLRTLSGLVA